MTPGCWPHSTPRPCALARADLRPAVVCRTASQNHRYPLPQQSAKPSGSLGHLEQTPLQQRLELGRGTTANLHGSQVFSAKTRGHLGPFPCKKSPPSMLGLRCPPAPHLLSPVLQTHCPRSLQVLQRQPWKVQLTDQRPPRSWPWSGRHTHSVPADSGEPGGPCGAGGEPGRSRVAATASCGPWGGQQGVQDAGRPGKLQVTGAPALSAQGYG